MILNFHIQNDFFTKKTTPLSFFKYDSNKMATYKYKDVEEDGELVHFEVYKSLLIIGDNGCGKTNLLTAIKFCLLVIKDNLSDGDQLFVDNYIKNNNYKYTLDCMYKNKILTISYESKNKNICLINLELDGKTIIKNNQLDLFVKDNFNLDLINNIKNCNNSLILNDCKDGNIHFLRLREALDDIDGSTSNQLIFATQNPLWLDNNKYFSEEQIYFIDKQEIYALSYYDLTEIKKRGENYIDAYLKGRFDAVPDLDDAF